MDRDAFERRLWRHLGSWRKSSSSDQAADRAWSWSRAAHLEQNAIPARTRSCRPPSAQLATAEADGRRTEYYFSECFCLLFRKEVEEPDSVAAGLAVPGDISIRDAQRHGKRNDKSKSGNSKIRGEGRGPWADRLAGRQLAEGTEKAASAPTAGSSLAPPSPPPSASPAVRSLPPSVQSSVRHCS